MMAMAPWIPVKDPLELRRLGKLGEELGELIETAGHLTAVVNRCIIQGLGEIDPTSGRQNRLRLEDEIADVMAQCKCTMRSLGLDAARIIDREDAKIRQMAEWDDVSRVSDQERAGRLVFFGEHDDARHL
jgi:NTP pyrophosphatase (non-canonical NTP hydrolase)